jgi:hypothetical protein
VYAWNTLGAIAGVLLAVHVGLPLLGLKGAMVPARLLDAALGLYLLHRFGALPPARAPAAAVVVWCSRSSASASSSIPTR